LSNNHTYDEIIKDTIGSTTQALTTKEASTTEEVSTTEETPMTEEVSTTEETSTTGKVTTKKTSKKVTTKNSTTGKASTAKSTTSRSSLSTTPKLNESTTTQEESELKDYWDDYDNFYPKLLICKFRLSEKFLKMLCAN
jgi:hypothetical protein